MNIYKNIINYYFVCYLQNNFIPKIYKFNRKVLHKDLSFITLYTFNKNIDPYNKNIEHIWCKSYSKNSNLKNDYHNTYLSCQRYNSIRSNSKFDFYSIINRSFNPDTPSLNSILFTISYIDLLFPDISYKHFSNTITKKYFRYLLLNYPFYNTSILDIHRSLIIHHYQKNHNPFILYPILFGLFYDLPFYKNIQLIKLTFKHILLFYSSKILSKFNSYNFIFNPYLLLNNSNEFINLSYVLSISSTT